MLDTTSMEPRMMELRPMFFIPIFWAMRKNSPKVKKIGVRTMQKRIMNFMYLKVHRRLNLFTDFFWDWKVMAFNLSVKFLGSSVISFDSSIIWLSL